MIYIGNNIMLHTTKEQQRYNKQINKLIEKENENAIFEFCQKNNIKCKYL